MEQEYVSPLFIQFVFFIQDRSASTRADTAHSNVQADVYKVVFRQFKAMLAISKLCRRVGVDRKGERLFRRYSKQILYAYVSALIVASRFLRAHVIMLVIAPSVAFIVAVVARKVFVYVAFVRAIAYEREIGILFIYRKL